MYLLGSYAKIKNKINYKSLSQNDYFKIKKKGIPNFREKILIDIGGGTGMINRLP